MKQKLLQLISLIGCCILSTNSIAQTTLIEDHFEGNSSWIVLGASSPNNWIIGSCTQNGGSKALYITSGGSTPDCSATGIEHYGYANSPGGSIEVIAARLITATCFTSMELQADIQIEGEVGSDFLEVVYSTDGGSTWSVIGAPIVAIPTYATQTIALPATLNNSAFHIGFRFTYNESNVGNKAPAIDNFRIHGDASDAMEPVISCPTPVIGYTDEACEFILPDYTGLATASDNCGNIVVTQNPAAGMVVDNTLLITLTATDPNGNSSSCSFQQQVLDTIKPKPSCEPIVYAYLDATCSAMIPDIVSLASADENCTPSNLLVYEQNPPAGSPLINDQNVFVTVTDLSGNTGTCFSHVILRDSTAPVINCPTSHTVSTNNSNCTYDIEDLTGLVTASDNCTATVLFNQIPSVGNALPSGNNTITIEVQDAYGNTASCQFTLEVIDQIPPTVTCPATYQVPANNQCMGIVGDVLPLAMATDDCTHSSLLVFEQNPTPTHNFSGSTLVTISVTDENGNTGTCTLTAEVIDTTGPIVTCLPDTSLVVSGQCDMTIPDLSGTFEANDNCVSSVQLTFSQNPPAGTIVSNPTPIVITYTDPDGNTGTCSTLAKPIETINPTITCPINQTQNNGSSCSSVLPDLTSLATVTDNCNGWTLTQQPAPNTPILSGTHTITITATDAAGNTASCTTQFALIENVFPSIICPNSITTCNPLVNYIPPTGSDNCQFVVTQTDLSGLSSGSIFPIGITTQTYEVRDSSGNVASCSFNIEVLTYPDTALIPNSLIYLCDTYTTTIEAQPIQSGTGSWSVLLGGGTITDPSSLQTDVSNLSQGINDFVWTVSAPGCGTTKDTVRIIVNLPPPQAQLADSIFACASTNFLIQGNLPVSGIGTWSSNSPIVFNNVNAPITSVSNIPDGFHTIYWTISAPGCPSTTDSSVLYAPSVAKVLTNDTTLCIEDLPIEIKGNGVGPGQAIYWILHTGSGTLTNKYQNETQLIGAAPGNLVYIYRLTHSFCPPTQDTLRLKIENCGGDVQFDIPTVFTPNRDGDNDYFVIPNLDNIAPDCKVTIINRWGGKVFESTGYANPWDGTFKGEDLPLGTYFYEIISPSNAFDPIKGSISIIR